MIRRPTAVALMILALAAPAVAQDDAARLLEQADRFRADWPSLRLTTRIDTYDGERLTESAAFEVALKGEDSLITFLSPRSKGQTLLMRGDDMWLYLPAVARGVRITPLQRLAGNTSNGDLARLRFAVDYSASLGGEETIGDTACVVLELRARRPSAAYQRVRYAVRKEDGLPIRAEYFLASGRPIKTAFFEDVRPFAGRPTVARIVIVDEIRKASKSVMVFERIVPQPIDDRVFSPSRAGG